jgi:hypothetical protein
MDSSDGIIENVMICFDNSEEMKKIDLSFDASQEQKEAVLIISKVILSQNMLNNAGIVTLSNETQLIQTLTSSSDIICKKLDSIETIGKIDLISGIRTAFSELINRAPKRQRMRIIAFVGSFVNSNLKELEDLAKELREEKVLLIVDIISFGEIEANFDKLNAFINELQNESSNLFTVKNPKLLSQALIGSPILDVNNMSATQVREWALNYKWNESDLDKALRLSLEQKQDEELRQVLQISALEMYGSKNNNSKDSNDLITEKVILESLKDINKETKGKDFQPLRQSFSPINMSEEEQITYALKISLPQTNVESKQQQKSPEVFSQTNRTNEELIFGSNNNYKKQQKVCKKFREGKDET